MLIWLLKTIKLYINCGIIAVVMGVILNIIGNFLSSAHKHNTVNVERFAGLNIRGYSPMKVFVGILSRCLGL